MTEQGWQGRGQAWSEAPVSGGAAGARFGRRRLEAPVGRGPEARGAGSGRRRRPEALGAGPRRASADPEREQQGAVAVPVWNLALANPRYFFQRCAAMIDNFPLIPDAESLPLYRMVLKLACVPQDATSSDPSRAGLGLGVTLRLCKMCAEIVGHHAESAGRRRRSVPLVNHTCESHWVDCDRNPFLGRGDFRRTCCEPSGCAAGRGPRNRARPPLLAPPCFLCRRSAVHRPSPCGVGRRG